MENTEDVLRLVLLIFLGGAILALFIILYKYCSTKCKEQNQYVHNESFEVLPKIGARPDILPDTVTMANLRETISSSEGWFRGISLSNNQSSNSSSSDDVSTVLVVSAEEDAGENDENNDNGNLAPSAPLEPSPLAAQRARGAIRRVPYLGTRSLTQNIEDLVNAYRRVRSGLPSYDEVTKKEVEYVAPPKYDSIEDAPPSYEVAVKNQKQASSEPNCPPPEYTE